MSEVEARGFEGFDCGGAARVARVRACADSGNGLIATVRTGNGNGGLGDAALPQETNLVICGDRKQSIYTWRGADPQVMPDLEQAILAREQSKLENLQTSYRSKPPILDVVNTLFESVYGAEEYATGDRLQPNPDFATENEKPCIEFLAPDDEIVELAQTSTSAGWEARLHE